MKHASERTQPLTPPAGVNNRSLFKRSALALAVAVAVAGIGGVAAARLPETSPLVVSPPTVQATPSFADLVQTVQPAVVNVAVVGKSGRTSQRAMPELELPDDSPFKEFFERFLERSPSLQSHKLPAPKARGVGSGFIVTPDGYIVTNHHVIDEADEIYVVLNDGQRLPAQVRGRDPKTDLALLKVEADADLPYVSFGDSDTARPGDWVLAIGNPFGLGGTVTTGIVSARGRDIQSGPYDDYLQIDAPINRGNSGGPLFDMTGRVIGVNTAIYSPTGGSVGIGFAVPAAQAKPVIEQLIATGYVERGWLGVMIQSVSEELAGALALPGSDGALVAGITPDSPAARAGIQVGDVILSFNQTEVGDLKDLPRLVAEATPGKQAKLTVWRDGKERELEVTIMRTPETVASAPEPETGATEGGKLGLVLAPLTPELRNRYGVETGVHGTLVVEVDAESPAARKGLRKGDVIVRVGNETATGPAEVAGYVRQAAEADADNILLLVNRQGNQWFVAIELA